MVEVDVFKDGLSDCARCGGTHEGPIDWRKMARPVHDAQLGDFQYWAPCPITGDPILLMVKDEPTSADLTAIAREAFKKAQA